MIEAIKEKEIIFEHLDRETVGQILLTFERNIADNLPGTTSEQKEWIAGQLEQYTKASRTMRAIERRHTPSQDRLQQLSDLGIDAENIERTDLNTIKVLIGFLETLQAIAAYLDQAVESDWPKKKRESERAPLELMQCGVEANIKFVGFFMKVQKILGLSDAELEDLYYELFGRHHTNSLRNELEVVALDEFPRGILAAIRAYAFLKTQVPENTVIHVPTIDEDLMHAVDLISETRDQSGRVIRRDLYQIKGRAGDTAQIFDLSNSEQHGQFMKLIEKLPDWDREKHIKTMEVLLAYRDRLRRENPGMTIGAYWVEVILPKEEQRS